MTQELLILTGTAASIGLLHTLFGPDHYLPFIVMSKARKWSLLKTTWITVACGIGHVLSSVVLGLVGVAAGIAVKKLEVFEGVRGNLAAWALIAFGLVYFVWGVRRAIRNRPHAHIHDHGVGEHSHIHGHAGDHGHVHDEAGRPSITPWVLFTIFVLGPCEPLIPILMYPAAKASLWGMVLVTAVFAVCTIGTMLGVVVAAYFGLSFLPMKKLERYAHAIAGATICAAGMAIQFLGL
jgi:sulfite exporter TauE/SafE